MEFRTICYFAKEYEARYFKQLTFTPFSELYRKLEEVNETVNYLFFRNEGFKFSNDLLTFIEMQIDEMPNIERIIRKESEDNIERGKYLYCRKYLLVTLLEIVMRTTVQEFTLRRVLPKHLPGCNNSFLIESIYQTISPIAMALDVEVYNDWLKEDLMFILRGYSTFELCDIVNQAIALNKHLNHTVWSYFK